MTTTYFRYLFIGGMLITVSCVHADIVLDGSIGAVTETTRLEESSLTLPAVGEQRAFIISPDLGVQYGTNLFYSFKEFNLYAGEIANFALTSNSSNVQNIINRVTGGTASFIDGSIISDLQGGNLFFINPAGVIFGEHAQIGLFSAFHVSTADTLLLGNNEGEFNARYPEQSLLSSAPPSAYGFLTDTPAPISLKGATLVSVDNDISLTGGDITIDNSSLWAVSQEIALVSLASQGKIAFNLENTQKDNVAIVATKQGNIALNNSYLIVSGGQIQDNLLNINAITQKSGDIYIYAGDFYVKNSALISGGVLSVSIDGTDTYQVNANIINNEDSGDIFMQINSLKLEDGFIATFTNGSGNGGDIYVLANERVDIGGTRTDAINTNLLLTSQISANTLSTADDAGQAGLIYIETPELTLHDGGKLESSSSGSGNAGGIFIRAGNINILGSTQQDTNDSPYSGIFVNALDPSATAGDAGIISIEANNLRLVDGGLISSSTAGNGTGGVINLSLNGNLTIGNGNTVNPIITTHDLLDTVANKTGRIGVVSTTENTDTSSNIPTKQPITTSGILAASESRGNAGSIIIQAQNIDMNNGFITTITLGAGNAGMVDINADNLSMTNGANISSPTEDKGDGGMISLNIQDTLNVQGGELKEKFAYPTVIQTSTANTELDNAGQAGRIKINTDKLIIQDALITSATRGSGIGNRIEINANAIEISKDKDSNSDAMRAGIYASSESAQENAGQAGEIYMTTQILTLKNGGSINTSTQNADGGNIWVTLPNQLYLRDAGNITTSVSGGTGNGGNISVQSPQFVVVNHGQIVAQATEGNGGNITIATEQFLASADADSLIDASSQKGIAGQIVITSPIVDISGNVISLPSNFLNATAHLQAKCYDLNEQLESRFIVRNLQRIGKHPEELRTTGYLPKKSTQPNPTTALPDINGQLFVQVRCGKKTA
ncbi:filamentous hemagglutinin N-terminal domain-containing protein [Beggiatoa leptomitoformis]|uniref:Filamentous hemagglutinin N-terminal domain-containing protein n=1 Tax=Beggiatoa leptomitoformis TaxID=288004 RepID=A0A2N9YEZ0_9GAMM|nr:filamentous hemagglutinin N-terminal domain-containing protein [Beggiatoa leptomitoformis]ALG68726.1 filamentous hemagglutinin N-terminal domain-containing protein [Beggiatoa leptomitoformis]AUI68919.1 filamentous hemagglutinin N-terminal domain-containing protein [Beggiatoa leptomitoformis]